MRSLLLYSSMICLMSISSCKKDDEPEPEPEPEFCDNVNSAFQAEVLPIFTSTCGVSGCHDSVTEEDDKVFEDYGTITASIEQDQQDFIDAINFNGGTEGWMPRPHPDSTATTDDQLPQEKIDKIECWIERGMPND